MPIPAARRAMIDAGIVADAVLALARKSEMMLRQSVEDHSEDPSVSSYAAQRPNLLSFPRAHDFPRPDGGDFLRGKTHETP
uniref:Uncharacterized protein n=1 Tax=Candidatus Kentrum sp. DK TaxID=2126562 RepID=A0A450RTK5_9GAMM|nr:MAG: hypothetical protein BECKDK2373C_GA0170839_100127 [Candidatus Kentron sp. DK]